MLRIDDHGRVRVLILDRPGQLNAFTDGLYDAVRGALTDAAGDDGIAVVVLTGEGHKAFSAGQDLGEMVAPPQHDDGDEHGFAPFIRTVAEFPKPLLAAVNGLGVGIGCTVLPHCDVVLIADTARLRAPFTSLGVCPEAASSTLLPTLMGWQAAAEFLFTSEWIDADQAVELRLARRKVRAERLLHETIDLAQRIAAMPLVSLVETKRLMKAGVAPAMDAALEREWDQFRAMVGGPANREAIDAFREKRAPDFSRV